MRKKITTIITVMLAFVLFSTTAVYASWFDSLKEKSKEKQETTDTADTAYVEGYDEPQAILTLHETKIISPAFGTAVGRMLIPDGWDIAVADLTLGTETISCPNAVMVIVSSPDGDCDLVYISKREFKQTYAELYGIEATSEDDSYDYGTLTHMLDYRDADECCDLMAELLFDANALRLGEIELSKEEKEQIKNAESSYIKSVYDMMDELTAAGVYIGEMYGAACGMEKMQYTSDKGDIIVFAASCGFQLHSQIIDAVTDTILWSMPFVYAMRADDAGKYRELFDVFCSSTTVSEEFETMRDLNGQRLVIEYMEAMNGTNGGYTFNDNGSYDDIEEDTIESGDTYSAIDGWDDVIKDQNDYTTGSGEHVKVSTDYEHVFELDDGSIYATNSLDTPAGGIELYPTEIGE